MSERDRRDRDARRKAIHDEAESARNEEGSGGFTGARVVQSDEVLEKLGVKKYQMDSGEDNKGKTHTWSLLEPKLDDPEVIALGLFVHWDVGVDGGSYLCPREMKCWLEKRGFDVPEAIKTGACPVCEEADRRLAKYKQQKDNLSEDDRKKAYEPVRKLRSYNGSFSDPKPNRFLAWIVDEKDLDAGVQLAEIPQKVYLGLINQADDPETGETLDVLDPSKDGWTFSFKRSGKGREGVVYDAYRLRPRKEALDKAWLDAVPSFWDAVKIVSYDDLKEAFEAVPPEDKSEGEKGRGRQQADGGRQRTAAEEDGDKAKDEVADHFSGEDQPRRRRSSEPEEAEKPRARTTESEGQPRRRRAVEDEDRGEAAHPSADDVGDGEVSDEAKALAERIRNRRREQEAAK